MTLLAPTIPLLEPTVRVLGIDASLTRSGFAYAGRGGFRHDVIATNAREPLAERLRRLSDAAFLACQGGVDLVVIEEPGFSSPHGSAVAAVSRAQGAILVGLPTGTRVVVEPVARVRSAMGIRIPGGKGKAKAVVTAWITEQGIELPYSQRTRVPDDNVADAYVLALYGLRLLLNA